MSKSDDEEEEREERLWEERSKLRYERRRPIMPRCCAALRDHTAIVLVSNLDGTEPRWVLRLQFNSGYDALGDVATPICCPFCATPLPKIVLRDPPPTPLCVTNEWGDHCITCEERGMNCYCYPPWAIWEAP